MIKFGIMSRDQIRANAKKIRSSRRLLRFIAFTLLRDFGENLSDTEEEFYYLLYRIVPTAFGAKGTWENRYESFDGKFVEEIEKIFPADCPLRVHDMAASNAITSLKFFERLKHRKYVRVHATDYYDALYVVAVPGSRWEVVFDAEHRPLQFVGHRMVIDTVWSWTWVRIKYPINWLVKMILCATLLPKASRILEEDAALDGGRVERIELFHPRCIAAARSDSRFTLGRDNLFEPAAGSYEVIRVMGIAEFLPPDRKEAMFLAVSEHLVDGGLLIVSRHFGDGHFVSGRFVSGHVENSNAAQAPTAIFQRRGVRFVLIRDLVNGYPYKDLLLGLDLTATAGSTEPTTDQS